MFDLETEPHRRYNPLADEWVIVAPQRLQRPWQGQVEPPAPPSLPQYDPHCYLCPGNTRAGGAVNPNYTQTLVLTNDYAVLVPDGPVGELREGLLLARSEQGTFRVVCYSPRHDLSLGRMPLDSIGGVIDVWIAQFAELSALPWVNHVQIFENRGAMMGSSNPHPHGQIAATATLPTLIRREHVSQSTYFAAHGRTLLGDYVAQEVKDGSRVVLDNEHFVALVPFWAAWPFETLVISRRRVGMLGELTPAERLGLADLLGRLTACYDKLFQTPFPYAMGFHQQPADAAAHPEWHLHAHFFPPLLRSATVRKFMAGYELLAELQRDLTPEGAAARLRAVLEPLPFRPNPT